LKELGRAAAAEEAAAAAEEAEEAEAAAAAVVVVPATQQHATHRSVLRVTVARGELGLGPAMALGW
jgi:hypothetical protein